MITKQTTDIARRDFMAGEIILIDKPIGWSSFKVVFEIRRMLNTRKVGHTGTLDPMATGLLILCTGKKTKEVANFQQMDKTYTGMIRLGKTTPSMDLETEPIIERPYDKITREDVMKVRDEFIGPRLQTPPMFSAKKFEGKALYKYARKGKMVERKPTEVTIYKFEILKISPPYIYFEIRCTKGTYIRVIANDFGEKLGCGGVLASLRRTEIGEISVEDAILPQEFFERFNGRPVRR